MEPVETFPWPFGRFRDPRHGWIYFLQVRPPDGPIKIGWSVDPRKRAASIQTDNADVVYGLSIRPGIFADENRLHEALAAHKLRGEWFNPTPEVLAVAYGGDCPLPQPRAPRQEAVDPDCLPMPPQLREKRDYIEQLVSVGMSPREIAEFLDTRAVRRVRDEIETMEGLGYFTKERLARYK